MAIARDTTFIWTSWLAKLMAGQQACEFSAWFKAHYRYEKLPAGDFDAVTWTMQHTRLIRELRIERLRASETIYVGAANSFLYQPRPGVALAGRPDLVGDDFLSSPVVYTVKTGHAKASDSVELLIHMHVLPLAVERYRGIQMRGCVVYPSGRTYIPETAIDEGFVSNFDYFLEVLAADAPAPKAPSDAECRSCNIGSADCPERWPGASTLLRLA